MTKVCSTCKQIETLYSPPFSEVNEKWLCRDCFLKPDTKNSKKSKWDWLWSGMTEEIDNKKIIDENNYCCICGEKELLYDRPFEQRNGCWFCWKHTMQFTKEGKFPTAKQIAEWEINNLKWVDLPDGANSRETLVIGRVQQLALEKTNSRRMASLIHLGGHPDLPNRERIVLGLSTNHITFYDYRFKILSSSALESTVATTATRHISSTSRGSTYFPKNSPIGSTISNQSIDMHPDTLIISLIINGVLIQCQFDTLPYNALDLTQSIYYVKTHPA